MKKTGFTLAETLVSLAVAGIIITLAIQTFVKVKPDKNKIEFLKTYDAIVVSVKSIVGNSRFYNSTDDNYYYADHVLANTAKVSINNKEYGGSTTKLCELLAENFNSKQTPKCSDSVTYSDSTFKNNVSFTDDIGVKQFLVVSSLTSAEPPNKSEYQTDIYFDINGDEGNNCIYSSTCTNPDRFKLMVSSSGKTVTADPVSEYYSKHRIALKKANLTFSSTAKVADKLPDSDRKFLLAKADDIDSSVQEIPVTPEPEPESEPEPEPETPAAEEEITFCDEYDYGEYPVMSKERAQGWYYYQRVRNCNGTCSGSVRLRSAYLWTYSNFPAGFSTSISSSTHCATMPCKYYRPTKAVAYSNADWSAVDTTGDIYDCGKVIPTIDMDSIKRFDDNFNFPTGRTDYQLPAPYNEDVPKDLRKGAVLKPCMKLTSDKCRNDAADIFIDSSYLNESYYDLDD